MIEIIDAIRSAAQRLHISAKFGFFHDDKGEFNIEECVKVSKLLAQAGIDSLEVLGNHSEKENGTRYEACYLELALRVKQENTGMPVILTGNNHDIYNMEQILFKNGIEMYAMSRPLIREPDLPLRWENGSTEKAKCISCGRCYTTHGKRCIFNILDQ